VSILLDALKKSEQQRQLGQVPDIHSSVGTQPSPTTGRRRWVTWVLVACIVTILVWQGWQKFGQPDSRPDSAMESAEIAEQSGTVASDVVDSAPATRAADDKLVSKSATAQRTPVETLPVDDNALQGDIAQPPAKSLAGELRKSRVNQSFAAFEAPPQAVAGQPQTASLAQEQAAAPEHTAAEQTAAEPEQTASLAQEPAGAEPQVPVTAATGAQKESAGGAGSSASEPRATEPISFWELPQGIRDSLPDLHITVLVFAERPEDRFLLMGGQRMVEKDQFQDGVVLEEIRRDGAVFLYRNYRFLVKG